MTVYLGDIIELAGGVPALHPERKGQLNRSPLKNWVEKNGGLPTYINSVATALLREHPEWGISRIIATAVNWAKKTCATGKAFGGKVSVSKAVQAAACNAVRQWEAKKAKASEDSLDEILLRLTDEKTGNEYFKASLRKSFREDGQEIPDILNMSDEQYFKFLESDTEEPVELSWSYDGEGVIDVANEEAFMDAMELSAAAQSAVRLPFNMSTMERIGDKFKKEILRVGEIVVDSKGRKFNFTPDFLKGMVDNFGKVLDYVPLLYTDDKNRHVATGNASNYAGTIEQLSVDDPENPQKVFGTFNLTDEAKKMVEHNPKYGVSVTAHPAFVDPNSGDYYGPMLLDVAGTHDPKLKRMEGWEKVSVMASEERSTYDVLDLSNETFVEALILEDNDDTKETEGGSEMADELNLSNEQIAELLESDAVKTAISTKAQELIDAAVAEKDEEITRLSTEVGDIKKSSYETVVKSALSSYRTSGVPPVMVDAAEALMLSFNADERNEKLELSVVEGEETKKLELSKVQLVTKLLDEAKGFIDLSEEKGEENDELELSKDQEDEAVSFLTDLIEKTS